ncbi:MAG: 5-formyltetrahydrofolate cyclo-ligase [Candidatus Pristimantibacillus sp.]
MNEQLFENSNDKQAFRKSMTQLRNQISEGDRASWSEAACKHLCTWLEENHVTSLMTYISFRSELDTSYLLEWAWLSKVDVIVPKSDPSDHSMTLHHLGGWSGLSTGAYGIMEPDPLLCPPLPASYIPNVIVTPGLAFDRRGGRLGYGGGYYDRYADQVKRHRDRNLSPVLWIGTAFEAQIVDNLPMQNHDQVMNGLVTEQGLQWFT